MRQRARLAVGVREIALSHSIASAPSSAQSRGPSLAWPEDETHPPCGSARFALPYQPTSSGWLGVFEKCQHGTYPQFAFHFSARVNSLELSVAVQAHLPALQL